MALVVATSQTLIDCHLQEVKSGFELYQTSGSAARLQPVGNAYAILCTSRDVYHRSPDFITKGVVYHSRLTMESMPSREGSAARDRKTDFASSGRRFWRDGVILGGLFLFVAFRVLYYWRVASTLPQLGDEGFYYQNASVILGVVQRLLSGQVTSGFALAEQLVDRGWFLPGMSVVLAPVCAITNSVPLARMYVAALNSVLFVLCARRLALLYGMMPARIALAFVAVFPYHAAFSFAFWGDLIAAHGVLYLLTILVEIQREIQRRGTVGRSRLVLTGVMILVLIYIRPNLILLVPASVLGLFLFYLQFWPSAQAFWRSGSGGALVAAIVALGLSPWSYSVSKKFGGLVITTTTVDVNVFV